MDDPIARIAAQLAPHLRTATYPRGDGRGSFEKDYGPTRTLPFMEPQGLRHGGSRNRPGDRSGSGQSSLVARGHARFLSEIRAMCPGTRVFYACLCVASAITAGRVVVHLMWG